MDKSRKNELIAACSGWLSALLNFFPGLGVGYIYQRRWRAYWNTIVVSISWLLIGYNNQLKIDPSDPGPLNDDMRSFLGLFLIATITSIESWYTANRARKNQDEQSINT